MADSDTSQHATLPVIVAESAPMQRVLELARRAAASDATVLIQGDTGTGKELVARTIHAHSKRRERAFVPVNCGAYTDSLLASELFGHIRGAFTGAFADRKGVFEAASGGTVFLDEIGAMSAAMQVKVLRVLQEQSVLRVGASRELDVDVRVVAATNTDLAALAREGTFREDLYYRVKVVSCWIPPLRERRDDILPLAKHYLSLFAKESKREIIALSAEAEVAILSHDWPGNVRQLRAEMEQIVAMAGESRMAGVHQLSEEVRGTGDATTSSHPIATDPRHSSEENDAEDETEGVTISGDATYQELLDVFTRKVVTDRLERYKGNISKTAKSLAISRSTLYALLKKYGLQ